MNPNAAAKIKMLKRSRECLVSGLISLVVLIGVPFAMMAMASKEDRPRGFFGFCFFISVLSLVGLPFAVATIVSSAKVRAGERKFWNAARPYRIIGGVCAMLALIASFIVIALVGFLITNGDLDRG
jgi:magnesium-transporting ATPase (P-type)